MVVAVSLSVGVALGFFIPSNILEPSSRYELVTGSGMNPALPDDLVVVLDRFTLVNKATNQNLEKFMMLGVVDGTPLGPCCWGGSSCSCQPGFRGR